VRLPSCAWIDGVSFCLIEDQSYAFGWVDLVRGKLWAPPERAEQTCYFLDCEA
jgi:hypothetical protein